MNLILLSTLLVPVAAGAGRLPASDEKPLRLDRKAAKGEAASFLVERSATLEGHRPGHRDPPRIEETRLEYLLEVVDRKEDGDRVVKVTFRSLRWRQGDQKFDSSKPEGSDPQTTYLRLAMAAPITVKMSGDRIAAIEGLPERDPVGKVDAAILKVFQTVSPILSRPTIEADLGLIFSTGVPGGPLEKEKEYVFLGGPSLSRPDPAAPIWGYWFFLDTRGLVYRFQGRDAGSDGLGEARFSLSGPARLASVGGRMLDHELEGRARVSTADGLLLGLEMKSVRSAGEFRATRKTSIRRLLPAENGPARSRSF